MEINNIPEIKSFFSYIFKVLDIESILCYGSYATGLQDEKSDIDLLIIVKKLPLISQLQNLHKLDGFKNIIFKNAEHWDSSWSMINITLETMAGLKIEVGYNTTAWVKKVIKKLIENHEISFQEFPFRPYTLLGLLEYSKCLYDRNLFISNLKTKI
jgi:nucleotidyltransferase-like protein